MILILGDDRCCVGDARLSSTFYLMVVDAIEYSRTMSAVHLVGSRRETAAEFGDGTRLLGKRDDSASLQYVPI